MRLSVMPATAPLYAACQFAPWSTTALRPSSVRVPSSSGLGTSLYLDLGTVIAALAPNERNRPVASTNEGQLCPAPVPDTPHGAKDHILDFEDDFHLRVNRIAPIPRGFAVRIVDPVTGEWQYPDDCFRYMGDQVDGDMKAGDFANAKGQVYAKLLNIPVVGDKVMADLVDQAKRHLRAAEARGAGLKIYFAEEKAADLVRTEFKKKRPASQSCHDRPQTEQAKMIDAELLKMVALSNIFNIVATRGTAPGDARVPGDALAGSDREAPNDRSRLRAMVALDLERDVDVVFDPRLKAQIARVLAATSRTGTGRLVPEAGCRILDSTDGYPRSRHFCVEMFGGNDNDYHDNDVSLRTDALAVPDPHVVSYGIFRGALLAIVETFEATQAVGFPSDMTDLWWKDMQTPHDLQIGWISYVAPRFAHLVTPPRTAVVEYRPDGGLLMAATDETFVMANPAHFAVAKDIKAALTAFNAVPRTAASGK